MLVLAGLSTGHKIGLGIVGAVFICFALLASFVAPRRRPDFPAGRLSLTMIADEPRPNDSETPRSTAR